MKNALRKILVGSALGAVALSVPLAAQAQEPVKVGVINFYSGGASGPFGIPAKNAAEVIIEGINAGTIPAPYNSVGIAGARIEPIYVDENSKQKVADFKKLVQGDGAQIVIGYTSSGSCKAIAPVAEEVKALTIFAVCGTPQIFEEVVTEPKYAFRTISHATSDNVGAARYIIDTTPDLASISGINQNYAWGQDSWRDFSAAISKLKEDVEVKTEQFPKIFAGQYGSEISALLTNKSDVVHSSLWGGDMEAFILQGGGRGLFDNSKVVLTVGDTAVERFGKQIADGTVIGARGPYGLLAPDNALNKWFTEAYVARFGAQPVGPSYQTAQALLALKAAADKAGSVAPEDISAALAGLTFEAPSGTIQMALAGGHQAIAGITYGTYKFDEAVGKGTLVDLKEYPAECVNPPAGVKGTEWIEGGLQGAKCN
ncbi:ABC transporter substrate-binding protein [Nitratireductor sp. XY-223]|uniref:ABC transporter substrate-binding protein n=1 Tax=Nitratireductor sp. XY-223 TaxID=2561926 RepID=UPI0010AA113E|nr:ABC transporter substrate-binding protein [Nitratireductor sp. XY-223]